MESANFCSINLIYLWYQAPHFAVAWFLSGWYVFWGVIFSTGVRVHMNYIRSSHSSLSYIPPDYIWRTSSFAVDLVSIRVPHRFNRAAQRCVTVYYVEDTTCRVWLAYLRHASVEAFLGYSHNCEKRLLAASCSSVHPCVHRE